MARNAKSGVVFYCHRTMGYLPVCGSAARKASRRRSSRLERNVGRPDISLSFLLAFHNDIVNSLGCFLWIFMLPYSND